MNLQKLCHKALDCLDLGLVKSSTVQLPHCKECLVTLVLSWPHLCWGAVDLLEEVATGYLSRELQVSKKEWDAIDHHKDFTPEQIRSQRLQLFGLLRSSVKRTFGVGLKQAAGDSSISIEEEIDDPLELQENGGEATVRPGFFRCARLWVYVGFPIFFMPCKGSNFTDSDFCYQAHAPCRLQSNGFFGFQVVLDCNELAGVEIAAMLCPLLYGVWLHPLIPKIRTNTRLNMTSECQ